jgi:WD40 repeat protein/beta-lactamase regulating signal transducer with metallopeptidase domain
MESFFIELFLRGFALCLLTALALLLLHRTAAAHRHLVCVLALLVLPMLPLVQRLMPSLRLLPPQQAATPERATVPPLEAGRLAGLHRKSESPASQELPQEPIRGTKPSPLLPAESGAAAHGWASLHPAPHREPTRKATPVLFALWALGAATLLIRLLVALFRLRRLEAESRKAMLGSVPIRISEQVETPLTWGIRRTIILLPAALLSGDRAVCESALRHEQAHIARWDWMWNLLAELVCTFCWFQPGAWWLRSRMRLESERACDDRVLLSGVAGPDYAAHLVQIVRSLGSNEVAPAMAQSRGMEERMRHILDGAKPRHAQPKWLAASALFALALLSLAALRVSARQAIPAEAKLPTDTRATTMNPNGAPSRRAKAAAPADKPATTARADGPQVNGSPAATLDNVRPAVRLENVIWGEAVDGLQPGFLLTTPGFPKNRRVSLNSRVDYKVLVRNTTGQERAFEFQCTKYGPSNFDPYLIPNDNLRNALSSPILPERFRAGGLSDTALRSLAYAVKLAPGEAVVVPEEFGLYIGDADKQSYPRMEAIQAGMNWIVQPITIRHLTAAERLQAENSAVVTTVDRDGKTGPRSVPLFSAQLEGKQLFARIPLEVGTNWDRTLTGHSNAVNALVFSPDSKRLVTGSADGTAIVWDVTTGRSRLTLKGRTAAISSVLYTPNGKFILTGCSDGAIHIWEATTGERLRSLAGPGGGVCALDISSDGAKIVGGYDTGTVKIWNTATGQALVTFAYDNRLLSAAISPDGKSLAAGYLDATLKVWDLQTQQSLFTEKIPESEGITGVHFDTQGYLYTWAREEIEDPEETHSGKIKTTAWRVWGVRPRRILSRVTFPEPPGTLRQVVSYSNLAMVFGLSEGRAVLNNMKDGPVSLDAHEGPVAAVAISPDGTLGATGGKRNGKGEAKIWDMQAHTPAKQGTVDVIDPKSKH